MNEPRRLLDETSDVVAKTLLRSWQDRVPEPGAVERVAVALGVGTAAMVTAPGTALATAATTATAKAAVSSSIPLLALGKWCAIGMASATVAFGSLQGVRALSHGHRGGTPRAGAQISVHESSRTAVPRSLPADPLSVTPRAAPEAVSTEAELFNGPATASTALRSIVSAPSAEPAPAVPASMLGPPSIAWEITALDGARRALEAHDPGTALDSLDRLDQQGPSATFGPEAMLLRIEALNSAGRPAEARVTARRFLGRYPSSAGADRVRAFLATP
jgi:hypothetical protein